MYKIEVFRNKRGQWQIRLRAGNGRIIMHSEEYVSKRNALKSADSLFQGRIAGIWEVEA